MFTTASSLALLNFRQVRNRSFTFSCAKTLWRRMAQLPGDLKWSAKHISLANHPTHTPIYLYKRNVLTLIQYLFSNPRFEGHMEYVPRKVWQDLEKSRRIYTEMSTAGWWEEMQVQNMLRFLFQLLNFSLTEIFRKSFLQALPLSPL